MTKKSIYILPNLLTTANMFCGFAAIIAGIDGRVLNSAWLIMAAMVFDLLDGRVARFTKATSAFGVEYDSFSDLVSFGIAPALTGYLWSLKNLDGRIGWVSCFVFMACAALRLARFNVMVSVVPKKYFQGLPSPVAAASIATLIIFYKFMGWNQIDPTLLLIIMISVGLLMVSNILFPSFKEARAKRESAFFTLLFFILSMLAIAAKPEVMLFIFVYAYIILGSLFGGYRILTGKNKLILEQAKKESLTNLNESIKESVKS